ncbi:hypothetical protein [Azospirillum griseum]|uniref:Uncharacterized protein n=1 Tax=Azospirillum griseum TaxID=2496639 RepID=A0A3S0IEG7_9PROT|nr:hypothetical protein [Azospirillum griseum]RTR19194.1 hypothetical protein EJ903_14320 [Azospirillum griseum]
MSWLSKLSGGGKAANGAAADKGPRPSQPPTIVIDHHEFVPAEFAIGSFRLRPYDGDLIAHQQFDFKMVFTLGEEVVEAPCHGLVVKLTDESGLVARYKSPPSVYERKFLDYVRAWKGL